MATILPRLRPLGRGHAATAPSGGRRAIWYAYPFGSAAPPARGCPPLRRRGPDVTLRRGSGRRSRRWRARPDPTPRSPSTSSGLLRAQVRRLRQPQPTQPVSLVLSRCRSAICRSIRRCPGRETRCQSALVGVRPSGQRRQRLLDLVEAQADPLGGPDERHAAQHVAGVAALVAGGALGGDQARRPRRTAARTVPRRIDVTARRW